MLRPTNHRISKLQEKKTAASFGGRTTPGSGNQWHSKGDVRTPSWLIECKATAKLSYSLKAETWSKIRTEALLEGRDPLMAIEFIDQDVSLVVLDREDFLALMNYKQELQDAIGSQA